MRNSPLRAFVKQKEKEDYKININKESLKNAPHIDQEGKYWSGPAWRAKQKSEDKKRKEDQKKLEDQIKNM